MASSTRVNKTIKVVVVGDGAVGKTSLLIYYTTKSFPHEYVPTVFDNYSCIEMHEGKPVSLVLWDTAGQEDYDKLRPLSYPQTDVFLVCFCVVKRDSFLNVKNKWVKEIKGTLQPNAPPPPFILIGTKADLRDDRKTLAELKARGEDPIDPQEAWVMGQLLGASGYRECSALRASGINDIFQEIIRITLSNAALKREKSRQKIKKSNTIPTLRGIATVSDKGKEKEKETQKEKEREREREKEREREREKEKEREREKEKEKGKAKEREKEKEREREKEKDKEKERVKEKEIEKEKEKEKEDKGKGKEKEKVTSDEHKDKPPVEDKKKEALPTRKPSWNLFRRKKDP